ncbi:MAG: hypothetical protein ACE5MG_05735 [Candidatus Methylomirabilales bacterium]
MNKFLGKCDLVDLCRKLFEFSADVFDCPISGFFETTIRNEMPYLFQFTRVEPDAM